MIRPRAAGAPLAALLLAHAVAARADEGDRPFTWLPGAARAIPRTTSASRDTPVLEYAYGPRAQASLGAEFGLLEVRLRPAAFRLGFYGMVALENRDLDAAFPPVQLWRGLVGASISVSSERLATAILGRGSLIEASILVGHESDHHTDDGGEVTKPGDIPDGGGGDFIAPDVAVRLPAGRIGLVTARIADRVFVRGALVHAPAADLAFRLRLWRVVQPTIALFGEEQISRGASTRNGFFARMLGGVALPGRFGELTPFYSLDVGTGKGLLVNRREVRSSLGVRYAPF